MQGVSVGELLTQVFVSGRVDVSPQRSLAARKVRERETRSPAGETPTLPERDGPWRGLLAKFYMPNRNVKFVR